MTTTDKILEFIIQYKREHDGNSPTIREIKGGLQISTTSIVSYHLAKLERNGKIILSGDGKTRQIQVVGGQWLYLNDVMVERLPPETEALVMRLKHTTFQKVRETEASVMRLKIREKLEKVREQVKSGELPAFDADDIQRRGVYPDAATGGITNEI